MQKVTLRVPDNKLDFFIELAAQLGLEILEEAKVSEKHKAIVRERIRKSSENPERLLSWDQVQDTFKFD